MVVRLSAADIEPLLQGLAILGTGGGGNPDWGRQILENDVRRGRAWQVIDLDEVADDALVVCAGMMGSVKAIEAIGFAALLERWEDDFPLLTVVRAMEGLLGRRIDAVIPFEAGGLNSPVVLTLAARMGIPAVDADALGRSAPETHMTSWHGHGVAITPMPLADSEGNIVVVSQAATPTYVDEIGRMVISRGGHLGANCHHPMSGREARDYSVPGTFSAAAALGRAVGEAADPVAAAMAALGASQLFRGRVVGLSEEEHPGLLRDERAARGGWRRPGPRGAAHRQERDDGALRRREPAGHVPRPGAHAGAADRARADERRARGRARCRAPGCSRAPSSPGRGDRVTPGSSGVLSGSLRPARPRVPPDRGAGPDEPASLIASLADRFSGGAAGPRRP